MNSQPPTTDDLRKLTGAPSTGQSIVDEQDFTVQTSRTPRPPWTQPLPKLMLVGVALIPVVVIAGLFLLGSHQSGQEQPAALVNRQLTLEPPRSGTVPNELEQTRQENAHLKAKAALNGQQQMESQMNKPGGRGKPIPVAPSKATASINPTQPAVTPPSPYASSRSEPPRMVTSSSQPMRETSAQRSQSNAEQSADAMQRWQQLARLGSYGSTQPEGIPSDWVEPSTQTASAISSVSLSSSPTSPDPAVLMARIAPTSAIQVSSRVPLSSEDPESVVVPTVEMNERDLSGAIASPITEKTPVQPLPVSILYEAEARILEDTSTPPALIAGEHSPAVLATPLVIDGTGKQPDRFTVLLAEPLMDSRGSIAIPASAQLLVQVEGVAATGQVQLSATAATWQEQGRTKEIILPTGAIQVRGKDGQPLIARQFTDKGKEIAALDAGQFLLGAVRRSAELYTRSNTRVENSNSTTVVTQENPPPNILAGALEGGTSAILDTISERNQRAVEAIQNRPPIHFIKAGSPVQVFVNQSMQLPM